MLETLYIKNLALIDEEEITFPAGMNVLTGETGAGKSILIGSILLALGGRADREVIRKGADHAQVELSFKLDRESQKKRCEELEIPLDGDNLLISRRITPGKSISRVNGEVVSVRQLKSLAETLIDIHGQREHSSLLRKERLRELLDAYAGKEAQELLSRIGQELPELRKREKELAEAENDGGRRKRELDYAGFATEEIEAAGLREGEEEELSAAFKKMENHRQITEELGSVLRLLEEEGGVLDRLYLSEKAFSAARAFDPALEEREADLTSAEELLRELKGFLSEYLADSAFSGEELERVSGRLSLIQGLYGKYGGSYEKTMAFCASQQALLEKYRDYEGYLADLRKSCKTGEDALRGYCDRLGECRRKAAEKLTTRLTEALKDLNFLDVRFKIAVNSDNSRITGQGADEVDFLISVNPGEPMKPLSEVASGGEISRILLALKSVFADKDDIPTLIFDEIDTGISGVTAVKVGEKMRQLAEGRQILCITHLPQIAAMGSAHYYIEKTTDGVETKTGIRRLSDAERPKELARMFGGEMSSEAALKSAEEMLSRNGEKA